MGRYCIRRVVPLRYIAPWAIHRSQGRARAILHLYPKQGGRIAVLLSLRLQTRLAVQLLLNTPETRVRSPIGTYPRRPTQHLTQPCHLREEACPPRWGAVLYGRGLTSGMSFSDNHGVADVSQHRETPRTFAFQTMPASPCGTPPTVPSTHPLLTHSHAESAS